MTEDKQKETQKETLWDYNEAKRTLETFRAEFRKKAEGFDELSKILRENPDVIDARHIDYSDLRDYLDTLPQIAKEFREVEIKNAERRESLIRMGVHLSEDF